ncbi:MAG: NAD-dependent epimerase/dehydratase family protein [Actinocrinis sp.]
MTTILVTGATGKVGQRLVPRLLNWCGDSTIRVLVRSAEAAQRFAELGAEAVVGDLREAHDRAKALAGADIVVNTAATFRGVPEADMEAVNRDAAIALGRDAAAAGVRRFVQISTILVFGPGRGRPVLESDEMLATQSYPRTKREAEEALTAIARDNASAGFGLVVVRLPFVYGEGDSHVRDIAAFYANRPLHQRLTVAHHADVAQAIFRAITTPGIEGRSYNVADDAPLTLWELWKMHGVPVQESSGADESAVPQDLDDPWSGYPDTSRIRDELGYRPVYPTAWSAKAAGAL